MTHVVNISDWIVATIAYIAIWITLACFAANFTRILVRDIRDQTRPKKQRLLIYVSFPLVIPISAMIAFWGTWGLVGAVLYAIFLLFFVIVPTLIYSESGANVYKEFRQLRGRDAR